MPTADWIASRYQTVNLHPCVLATVTARVRQTRADAGRKFDRDVRFKSSDASMGVRELARSMEQDSVARGISSPVVLQHLHSYARERYRGQVVAEAMKAASAPLIPIDSLLPAASTAWSAPTSVQPALRRPSPLVATDRVERDRADTPYSTFPAPALLASAPSGPAPGHQTPLHADPAPAPTSVPGPGSHPHVQIHLHFGNQIGSQSAQGGREHAYGFHPPPSPPPSPPSSPPPSPSPATPPPASFAPTLLRFRGGAPGTVYADAPADDESQPSSPPSPPLATPEVVVAEPPTPAAAAETLVPPRDPLPPFFSPTSTPASDTPLFSDLSHTPTPGAGGASSRLPPADIHAPPPGTTPSAPAPTFSPTLDASTPLHVARDAYAPLASEHPGTTPWNGALTADPLASAPVAPSTEHLQARIDELQRSHEQVMRERDAMALSLQSSESRTAHVASGITAVELERDRVAAHCAVLQTKWEALQTSHVQLAQTHERDANLLARAEASREAERSSLTAARSALTVAETQAQAASELHAQEQAARALSASQHAECQAILQRVTQEQGSLNTQLESALTAIQTGHDERSRLAAVHAAEVEALRSQVELLRTPAPVFRSPPTASPGVPPPTSVACARAPSLRTQPLCSTALVDPTAPNPSALGRPAASHASDDASQFGEPTPPFSVHPAGEDFQSLWTRNHQSDTWRAELRRQISSTGVNAIQLLDRKELPPALEYIDSLLIDPYGPELALIDTRQGYSATDLPDPDLVLAIARRARNRPMADSDPESDDASVTASRASVRTKSRGISPVRRVTTSPPPDDRRRRPPAEDPYSNLNEIIAIPDVFLSTDVQDREYVAAVRRADVIDFAGLSVFRRFLYTNECRGRREASLRLNPKAANSAAKHDCMDKLPIPADLSSDDTFKTSVAYKNHFRVALGQFLSNPLLQGANWKDLLQSLYTRFERPKNGHAMLAHFIRIALRDITLHRDPLLHAEVLLFKLDTSFYSREEGMTPFDRLDSLEPTMDAPTLMAKIVDFYLDKIDDHTMCRTNVLANKVHRAALASKVGTCLLNDERDPARGEVVFSEFNKVWGQLESAYTKEPTADKLAGLDLQKFAETHLKEVCERFTRERTTTERVKGIRAKLNPRSRAPAPVAPAPPPRRTAAAASMQPAPSHEPTYSDDDEYSYGTTYPVDSGLQPPPPRTRRRAASAERARTRPSAVKTAQNPHAPPYAAAAAPLAPEPRPASRSPGPSAPSGRRSCPPPAGSKGELSGKPWDQEKWSATMVDFDRLDEAVQDGQRTAVYATAAKARPTKSDLQELRLGRCPRPEQGQPYQPDACAYCFYRPKAKGQDARPNNPDFWRFGTGDGAHFPGMCDCFKRYLAEGGDASDPPNGRQFLQSALRERRRTA